MAAKKYFPLIVIVLAVSLNLPFASAQSASTDPSQARYLASSDGGALQRPDNPETQWLSLLNDPLPVSNPREENLLLVENRRPNSTDNGPLGLFDGSCRARSISGEWILDGYCFAYVQGCGPIFQDRRQCPFGARAVDPVFKTCGTRHAEVDLARRCSN